MPTFDQIINFINSFQEFINKLTQFSVIHYTLNTLVASAVSFLSFVVFILRITSLKDFINMFIKISGLEKKIRRRMFLYAVGYATLSGLASMAFIEIEFRGLNFAKSIIYGLLGAYFFRDKFSSPTIEEAIEGIIRKVEEVVNKASEDYELGKNKVKENLGEIIKAKIIEIIGGETNGKNK